VSKVVRWLPSLLVGAIVLTLISFVVLAVGFPVRKMDLNDTGVWVSNDAGGQFGRVNKAVGALDGRVSPPGARLPRYQLDVLQDGNLALGWDQSNSVLTRIDTATGKPLGDQGLAVDPTSQVDARGGTLALMDRTGQVWATHYDELSGVVNLAALEPASPVVASLGLPADAAAGAAGLAVGADGTVFAAGVNGRQVSVAPAGDGFAKPSVSDGHPQLKSVALTALGNAVVALDVQSGQLVLPGDKLVQIEADPLARLQQPGPLSAGVLVATSKALLRVMLDSGQVLPIDSNGDGAPAAPVRLAGCDFGVWAGAGRVVRNCDGGSVEAQLVDRGLTRPVFRSNHGQILVNDQADGRAYDLDTRSVISWPEPKPEVQAQSEQKEPGSDTEPKPKAVDDNLLARTDRTTVLHVLDNDLDTVGGVLAITGLRAQSVPDRATVEVSPDGQTVKLFLPDGVNSVRFEYTISDGVNTDTGEVTVTDAGSRQRPPYLRNGYIQPRYAVPSFGNLSIPVVGDWRDPEGDPVTVLSAKSDSGDVVPVTPDGQLDFTAAEADRDQDQTITYLVGDGGDTAAVKRTVKVRVLGRKSTTTIAPVAQPDTARGEVNKSISIFPLNNDTPGADPRNLNARLALNASVAQKAHLKVTTDEKSGRVTVVADREGPYFLEYLADFGNAAPAKGTIRIDVLADGAASGPVAMPDQAAMRGRVPVLVDVLGNDYDPAGNLLTVQSADPAQPGQLQAQVVGGRWLRILAQEETLSPNPQVVHYTVSNGSQQADGDVLVTQLGEVDQDIALPRKDSAVVRAGDSVLIPVLTNDTSLSGQALRLVTDGLGTGSDGQLPVYDRAKAADADQGDVGSAFVRGDQVRYVAPKVVTATRQVVIAYTVQTASGDTAESQAVVTIKPPPSADSPDAAPVANTVEMRVVSGSRVRILIPTTGQDPDGDSVTVTGIASAPQLGRVVGVSPNTITYEAYPTDGQVGTDTFRYEVADAYGRTGVGSIRIAVTAPGQTQAPVAIDDQIIAKPGASVQVNLQANDYISRDDDVSVAPLARTNNPVPKGASLSTDKGPLLAKAPEAIEQPVLVNYALVGNGGTGPQATVKISSKEGFNNPPTVVDQSAEITGSTGHANLLTDAWDVDGSLDALKPELLVAVEGATLVGKDLTVPLLDHPQVIPFKVTDAGGAVSAAVVYVPAAGVGAPRLKLDASIEMASNTTASFSIGDYVDSPRNKPVQIASAKLEVAPNEYLDGKVDDSGRFTLTTKNDYAGPASVTMEVMDGSSQTNDGVSTATVTIPVQVGAKTPVLRCPESTQTIVQGGEVKSMDITSLCHVWSPDPASLPGLTYSVSWANSIDGVTATGGEHKVRLQAGGMAPENGEGTLTIGIEGTVAKTATVRVKVLAAGPPKMRSVKLTDIKAGTPVEVPISLTSPLLDAQTKIVSVKQSSGGKASISAHDASVTITPNADTFGTLVFRVQATDLAADPGRETRWVSGTITMVVYTRPDAPGAPQNGPTVQSHAANLTWTPGNANGAAIDSYELKVLSGLLAGKVFTSRSPQYRVTGLKNGEDVTFAVRAHNKADWSDWSPSSAKVTPDIAPGAPDWVKVTDPEDHSVLVSWGKIANDGSAIKVIHVTGAGETHDLAPTQSSLRIRVPSNNEVYRFTVAGENNYDIGPGVSETGQSSGKPAGLSVAAPNPGAPVGASTNVVVSWTLASPEGPTPVTYDVVRSDGKRICTNVTRTTCTDDTVTFDGTTYTYTVTATNATGGAAHTTTARSSAWDAVGTPDNWGGWSAGATGANGQIKLDYTVPASRGGSSRVLILNNGSNLKSITSPGPDGGAGTHTLTGLTNGTTYRLSLRVCNESGRCTTSAVHNAIPFGPLSKPNVTATHSGTDVTGKATANGNGATATLILYIDGHEMGRDSGTGALSVTKTRDVGYSNTVTVRAVLNSGTTTPHRADPADDTTTETTPAPPPPPPSPKVSITLAGNYGGGLMEYTIRLSASDFSGSYTCQAYVNGSARYGSQTFTGDISDRALGTGGISSPSSVSVTCDGVRSATKSV
jgi:large repetitive protein